MRSSAVSSLRLDLRRARRFVPQDGAASVEPPDVGVAELALIEIFAVDRVTSGEGNATIHVVCATLLRGDRKRDLEPAPARQQAARAVAIGWPPSKPGGMAVLSWPGEPCPAPTVR